MKVRTALAILFFISIIGCKLSAPNVPSALPTQIITATVTQYPACTPGKIPAYSNLPIIAEENVDKMQKLDQFYGNVSGLAASQNGRYLAVTYNSGVGVVWDISATYKAFREWDYYPKITFSAFGLPSFNFDSSMLATGGSIIDVSSTNIIKKLTGAVIFSPARNTIALTDTSTVTLLSLRDNNWSVDYSEGISGIVSTVFSPDGSLLGEAMDWGRGEGVNILRVSDHKLLYSFPPPPHGHPAHFNFSAYAFLAFSPDNRYVATGTKDHNVISIWDLENGELVKELNSAVEMDGGYLVPDIFWVAFSRDSKMMIIIGYDSIIIKGFPSGELIKLININEENPSSSNYVTACALSNDGKLLFIGDSGGEVSIWGIPPSLP